MWNNIKLQATGTFLTYYNIIFGLTHTSPYSCWIWHFFGFFEYFEKTCHTLFFPKMSHLSWWDVFSIATKFVRNGFYENRLGHMKALDLYFLMRGKYIPDSQIWLEDGKASIGKLAPSFRGNSVISEFFSDCIFFHFFSHYYIFDFWHAC